MKKIFCLISTIVCCLIFFVIPTSAAGSYSPDGTATTSSGYFSAGQSVFLSGSSTVTSNDGKYDVYLASFQYDQMAINARPYSSYIYARAYTQNKSSAAGNLASFSTAAYGYSYSYYSGYGGIGETYYLKSNSSYSSLGASVSFKWHA